MRHPTMRAALLAAFLLGSLGAGRAPARVLEGKVVDRAGHPVAGATVELIPSMAGKQLSRMMDKTSLLHGTTPSRKPVKTATTGKDGAFRFDHLFPLYERILVRVGGVPRAVGFVHPEPGTTRVRLTSSAGVRIDGEVVDASHHRLAGAHVVVRSGLFDLPEVTTDAKGRFRVDAPIADVPYLADVYAKGHTRVRIDLATGTTNHVVLGEGRVISGIVKAGGKPVAGARVRARGAETTSGADGTFTLAGIAPGFVSLVASRGRTFSKGTPVDARASDVHGVEIDFPAPRAVVVHVVDTDGKPIAGATVHLGTGTHGQPPEQRTDAHGVATFTGQSSDSVTVVAEAPGRARTFAWSSASGPTLVRLPPGTDLHVHLATETSPKIIARLTVWVSPSSQMTPGRPRRVPLDHAGNATVPGLARGRYKVWLVGPVPTAAPVEVALPHPGVVPLRLVKGGRVTGRIVDPKGRPLSGILLYLSPASGLDPMSASKPIKTGKDGRFVFDGVGAGRFDVNVYTTPTWLAPRVPPVVKAGKRGLVIRMQRSLEIQGVVVDASGTPLGGATVAADRDTRDLYHRWGSRAVADATGHFTLTRLRDGRYLLVARSAGRRSAKVAARAGARKVRIVIGDTAR